LLLETKHFITKSKISKAMMMYIPFQLQLQIVR
jgi:hypothetical protein